MITKLGTAQAISLCTHKTNRIRLENHIPEKAFQGAHSAVQVDIRAAISIFDPHRKLKPMKWDSHGSNNLYQGVSVRQRYFNAGIVVLGLSDIQSTDLMPMCHYRQTRTNKAKGTCFTHYFTVRVGIWQGRCWYDASKANICNNDEE